MAKAVSTFISIGLLVGAQRAALYWQRNHRADESSSPQMTADAAAFLTEPLFINTNATSQTNSTILFSRP